MFKKYLSKFTIDILPSILATIVGAYIVNHYIVPKTRDDRPAAAAAAMPDSSATAAKVAPDKTAPDAAPIKPKNADKGADKPMVEKASLDKSDPVPAPGESRRHQPVRDKAAVKPSPAAVTPAVAPAVATVSTAPASDDERRDANGLARAAIERLSRTEPRAQEASRAPDVPRVQEAVRAAPLIPSVQQLPPPIVVATPSVEKFDASADQADRSESRRMRPPGDIPVPRLTDLQANAAAAKPPSTNVAEDVLSAAKSVFDSVIPRSFER